MASTVDQFANFVTSTVAGGAGGVGTPLLSTDTTLHLQSGDGAKCPASTPFSILLGTTTGAREIAQCTAISGDQLTLVRGQEGTSAQTWATGASVAQMVTAGNLTNLRNTIQQTRINVRDYGAKGDGTTDDTAAIQAAITAVQNAGGGVVFFPAGTYVTSASLTLTADGIILQGAGLDASVIKPASGAQFDVISTPIPASSGLAGYVRNYVGVERLKIDCSNMTGTTAGQGNGIHFYGARYSYIRDVFITGSPNYCIIFDGDSTPNFGYNCEVKSCIFDLCAAGILIAGSEAHEIVQNKFKYAKTACAANQPTFSSPSTTAMHLLATGGYLYVAGNVFGNSGNYTSEAVRLTNSGPCKIIGNRFDQCHAQAIRTTSGDHIIADNQIGNPGSTVAGCEGILLGASNNTITGNKFDVTNGAAAFTYCIREPSAQSNNVIAGNAFVAGLNGVVALNSGSTGDVVADNIGYNPTGAGLNAPATPTVAGTGSGGTLTAGTYQVKVTYVNAVGETTASTAGSATLTSGQNLQITSPGASGNATGWYAYVTLAGGSTYTRQQANGSPTAIGTNLTLTANPTTTGPGTPTNNSTGVTTPAVPGNGVAQTNNTGSHCMVCVAGGTVTAIAIGGVATGLTSGAFRLAAGQTITLTYSVSPSWQWFGD